MLSYGKALGRLHCLSMQYEPECRKWSYEDALVWISDVLKEYHAPECMKAQVEVVKQELASLTKNSETFGLVHYDFEEKLLVMRKFCNLYSYTRLIRCVAEEVADAPDWMSSLKKRLKYRIKQLQNGIVQ